MKKPFIISISGISGSGKTTIANSLIAQLPNSEVIYFDNMPVGLINQDYCEWSEAGADCNEWNLTSLTDEIIRLLAIDLDYIIIDYPFGKANHNVSRYIDFSVWIDTPLDISLARRVLRDFTRRSQKRRPLKGDTINELSSYIDFYIARHRNTYIRHIETIKSNTDIIVDGMKSPEVIVNEIVSTIHK